MPQTLLDRLFALDSELFHLGNISARSDLLDWLAPVFSLTWLIWALGCAAYAVWAIRAARHTNRWKHLRPVLVGAVLILATAGVTDLVTNEVKGRVGRLRPYQCLPEVHYYSHKGWQQNPADFAPNKKRADSFFSGHAAHSMAAATIAAGLFPGASPVVYAVPLLAGASRIYLGKHYPSDVLGGWAAGWLIAMIARGCTRRLRERVKPKD